MENQNNNVIHLADHIKNHQQVETFNPAELSYFKIEQDKISIRRFYSFIVDFCLILVLNTAAHVSYSIFVKNFVFLLDVKQQSALINGNLFIQLSVFLLIYSTYFFYGLYVLNGQTVGKIVFKLRTIQDHYIYDKENKNYTLNLSQAVRRTLGYLTCYFSFGSFFLFSLMSEDKRGIPDYFSATRTVSNEWLAGMQSYKEIPDEQIRIDITSLDKAS